MKKTIKEHDSLKPNQKIPFRLPERALTNIDIHKYVKKLKIKHFRGVFMRDSLPKKIHQVETGVINLDDQDGPGTHWTAYKKFPNLVIYFDSYGNLKPPAKAIQYFQSNGACKILFNHDAVQFMKNSDFHCGHLCISFLYNKKHD